MPTIQYSSRSAWLSVRLSKWACPKITSGQSGQSNLTYGESPPSTDSSIAFTNWRQCVLPWWHIGATWRIRLNSCILWFTRVHNRNDKWIGSAVFAHLTQKVPILYNWRPYPPEVPPSNGGSGPPCNTWCFGPMRAHSPNGTSIGSAVFAHLRQKVPILYNWRPYPPEVPPFKWGIWTPCNTWCFGPMRAHSPSGTSIGSAVFAQMTAEWPYTLQ